MKLGEYITGSGHKQGDWVEINEIKGIFIANLSATKSIIAVKYNKMKSYSLVKTNEMKKIDRPEGGEELFRFAKKHLFWQRNQNHRPPKE